MNNMIHLKVDDGTALAAYVAMPQGEGPFPGIIVFQEAFGVNSYMKRVADKLAASGYLAIVPELFHRSAPEGFTASYTDFPSVRAHLAHVTNETIEADARACFGWLQNNPTVVAAKIGCIGFCMGGKAAFLTNSILPVAASVSYYGGGIHLLTDRVPQLHGPQLLFWGGKDGHIVAEHRDAVVAAFRAAGKPFANVELSYGDHGFSCDERAAYNAEAAKEAWAMTLAFFANKLG